VTINTLGLERTRLEQLRSICAAHRGDRPLFLRMESPHELTALVRCSEQWSVRPDEGFQRAVEALAGEGSVQVHGVRRPKRAARDEGRPVEAAESPSAEERIESADALAVH